MYINRNVRPLIPDDDWNTFFAPFPAQHQIEFVLHESLFSFFGGKKASYFTLLRRMFPCIYQKTSTEQAEEEDDKWNESSYVFVQHVRTIFIRHQITKREKGP